MGKILSVNDLKSYTGLDVSSLNTSLCPTKSQIEGYVKSGYGVVFDSSVAKNQLVDEVITFVKSRYVKGVCVINKCYHYDYGGLNIIGRDVQQSSSRTIAYNTHTGIISNSNTWDVSNEGTTYYEVGWLDSMEYEGMFLTRVWASTSSFQVNGPGTANVDYYDVFIGYGEGCEIVPNIGVNTGYAIEPAINNYIENYLGGDGSNYYFYIEIGDYE